MPTRLYFNARGCPIDRCPRTVRPGHLMCAAHWRKVPQDVQSDVWRFWRRWNKSHNDEDWASYMEARTAAIDAVEAISPKR